MRCDECDCSLLNLDYKEMCSTGGHSMLWLIILEVSLLLIVLAKFSWDCVTYRRTGEVRLFLSMSQSNNHSDSQQLPWLARHLCCSLQGLPATNWCSQLTNWRWRVRRRGETSRSQQRRGSSGYMTCSGGSNNTAAPITPHKESSVVRFS